MASIVTLLNLYHQQRKWRELTSFFKQIQTQQDYKPNSHTYTSLLKSSPSLPLPLHQSRSLHAHALKSALLDDYVVASLIAAYAAIPNRNSNPTLLLDAHRVFDEIPHPNLFHWNTLISGFFRAGDCEWGRQFFEQLRETQPPNVITWSAVISGYAQNSQPKEALVVFKEMREASDEMGLAVSPNSYTISSVFSACGQLPDLCIGEQALGYAVKTSEFVENGEFVGCALIDMFGRCGRPECAKSAFDHMARRCVVAWSTLIASYVRNECPLNAIQVFRDMVREGTEPNYVTLSTLITACADVPSLVLGKELHCCIIRKGDSKADVFVSTSLINMYRKCRYMMYARRILEKDTSTVDCSTTPMWNAAISGYIENECFEDAWRTFRSLNRDGNARPNSVTMAIVFPLCTRASKLLYGKELHCHTLKTSLDENLFAGNSLLDMYAKSGKLHLAENQFRRMIVKNAVSWTTMIDGYGMHGDGEGAIRVFRDMIRENIVKPDHITFVALVSACSHAGLVEEGLGYFESMTAEYGIVPTEENYGSVVDLLARGGHLGRAKKFIAEMPIAPGANVWGALLGACKIHGDVKEAESAAEELQKLEPREGGFRKLLSSIYSDIGNLDSVAEVRSTMGETGVEKRQGLSWLETNEGVYGFAAGNSS